MKIMNKLRFAPSPTGNLHVGNFRTALINYLFAKKTSGKFFLRIDDTDTERSKIEFENQIKDDLVWSGINWDAQIRQTDRLVRYNDILKILIDKELAYPCFEDVQELNLKRKAQLSSGKPPVYDRSSLNLTKSQIEEKINNGYKPHYRFFLNDEKITWNDMIRGECNIVTKNISDPILVRQDGRFIYTLASVVDDMDYEITHIIRGEDHVTNSAIQTKIFTALNATIPIMGHLPLMTDIGGGGLSKRIGSLSIIDLKEKSIQPQVLNSYLSKTGSSENIELQNSIEDLINSFEISSFSRASTKFDFEMLKSLNIKFFQSIHYKEISKIVIRRKKYFTQEFWNLIKMNVTSIEDINEWLEIVYGSLEFENYDISKNKKYLKFFPSKEIGDDTWSQWLKELTLNLDEKKTNIIKNIRLSLTGKTSGPEMSSLLKILGKNKIFKRLT